MLSKRDSIVMIIGALTVGRTSAADPPKTSSDFPSLWDPNAPVTWTIPLDRVKSFVVTLGDRKVEISAAEIMASLEQ